MKKLPKKMRILKILKGKLSKTKKRKYKRISKTI